MPKVTRNTAAVAARPIRKARPVFGDVSNNDKGKKEATKKRSTATTAARTRTTVVVAPVTDNAVPIGTRRRSSRLSNSPVNEATLLQLPNRPNNNDKPLETGKSEARKTTRGKKTVTDSDSSGGEKQSKVAASKQQPKTTRSRSRSSSRNKGGRSADEAGKVATETASAITTTTTTTTTNHETKTSNSRASNKPIKDETKVTDKDASIAEVKQEEEAPQRRKTRSVAQVEEQIQAPPARSTRASSRSRPTQELPARTKSSRRSSKEMKRESTDADAPIDDSKRPSRATSRSRASSRSRAGAKATTSTETAKTSEKGGASKKARATKRSREGEKVSVSRKSSRANTVQTASAIVQPLIPCCDFFPKDDFRLNRGDLPQVPFDFAKYTRAIAPVDQGNQGKVLEVPEYVTDIMQRLFAREVDSRPHPYMNEQPELNTSMRSILVDWIVEVHMKFRLEQIVLYLAINILDRYLERVEVTRASLQLVGITSLLIACKVEEIYPPEIQDCVYICDRAYRREHLLDMEKEILGALEYKVSVPTGYPFLNRFLHITKATELQKIAANYYMERMLQEYSYLKHRPSLIAAAVVSLALNNPSIRSFEGISGPMPGVPLELLEYTGFEYEKLREVAAKVAVKVKNTQYTSSRRELFAVKRKYQHANYMHVSTDFSDPDVDCIPPINAR